MSESRLTRKVTPRHYNPIYVPSRLRYYYYTERKPIPDKIVLELYDNENESPIECGICLSDDVKTCRMVSLNCGHSMCDKCLDGILDKSCNTNCPFCREEISEVETKCGESFGLLKENDKFVTDLEYEFQ